MKELDPATFKLAPELGPINPEPSSQEIVVGDFDGRPLIGLALKRTYRIGSRGGWEPVSADDQETVLDGQVDYYEAEPPFCAPVAHGNDVIFRPNTDVVVQGSAYPFGSNARRTTVGVRIGSLKRDIAVFGDRRVERGPSGELRFSEPEPFESMSVRYDRAYGGVDLLGFMDYESPVSEDLEDAVPHIPFDQTTPYHYPRNPAGAGFVVSIEGYELGDLPVPNLEYDFDPVTASRLAVGTPDNWPVAPLPAGLDWFSAAWFPRLAYLGLHCLPGGFVGTVTEQQRGWAAADLLGHPLLTAPNRGPVSSAFGQGASPGMVHPRMPLETIQRGIPVKITNMHPDQPDLVLELPREWPRARLGLSALAKTDLDPHLAAIVIRPAEQEVVMVWSATTGRDRLYTPGQLAEMAAEVEWRREPRT